MKNNTEINSHDLGKEYQIYYDSTGDSIVACKNSCYYNGTKVSAFNVDENMYTINSNTHTLGLFHGHRFDHNNHNWMMTPKYMALPFNYMSFVIKRSIENND